MFRPYHCPLLGWSGYAMILGKLSVPERRTIRMIVGQGPRLQLVQLGIVWTFYSSLSFFTSFSLSLGDGLIQTHTLSQRAVKPKTTSQSTCSLHAGVECTFILERLEI